jgi:hypothetical protein
MRKISIAATVFGTVILGSVSFATVVLFAFTTSASADSWRCEIRDNDGRCIKCIRGHIFDVQGDCKPRTHRAETPEEKHIRLCHSRHLVCAGINAE